jgi:hypothetical protein
MEFEPADTSVPDGKLPNRLEPFYDSRARYLFCKALEEHTPEVLDSLRVYALPVYQALTVEVAKKSYRSIGLRPTERVGLDVDPLLESALPVSWWEVEQGSSHTAEAQALCSAIENWRDEFHLTDEWILDLAMQTLFRWRQQIESREPVLLQWQRLSVELLFGLFDGQGPEFRFRHPGWNLRDDWQAFKSSVEDAFESIVAGYHRQVVTQAYAGGWDEAPDIREQLRFKWLALWQVKGHSAHQIQDATPQMKVSSSNVEKQVQLSAKQAGVTPRPSQKGRRQNRN